MFDTVRHPEFAAWAFLAVALWGLAFTINALRPRPHDTATGELGLALSFFSAWVTTELVLHHFLVQALVTVGFVAMGALAHPAGGAAALLTLGSWAGLGVMFKSAWDDGAVVAAALHDDLGITPERPKIAWRRVLWPFGAMGLDLVRHRDLAYLDDGSSRHRLDVYHRSDQLPSGAPILLQIHGGAWIIGDKRQQGMPLVRHMAGRGWLCVATNYGLSPRATWPDHLIDCKRALAWIRAHAAEYGGDPSCVVVTGGSAGGHLAAMMALTANDPEFQPGFEEVDTSVRAFVPFYGVFDWTDRFGIRGARDGLRRRLERWIVKRDRDQYFEVFDRASPLSRLEGRGDAIPPALVIHGRRDNLAPVAEARAFVSGLRTTSEEAVVYVELGGAHHAFDLFASVRTLQTNHAVETFGRWVVAQHRAEAESS
ncbi:MAG: alpha/beta hydrolase [Myxococcota bacterium]